jgi:hypothetical protein
LVANEECATFFHQWLNRLSYTAEGKPIQIENRNFQAFYTDIVRNLELAETNEEFRGVFWRIIAEGSTSCGDRIALSVIYLSIAHRGLKIAGKGIKDTWEYCKEGLALTILQKYARETIPKMRFFDEIEVYLEIILKGWEKLDLPLFEIREMVFSSDLSEAEFDAAAEKVRAAWGDRELVSKYLLDQPEWISALFIQYPNEMKEFEIAKTRIKEIEKEVTYKMRTLSEENFKEDPLCKEYEAIDQLVLRIPKELTIGALTVLGLFD